MGVGKIVCQTVLLFDGLPVHPFVCYYTVLCMFLSVCLSISSSIVCLCVRPSVHVSVRPSACMHIFMILSVTLSVCMFSSVHSSSLSSVRLVVFRLYKSMPV